MKFEKIIYTFFLILTVLFGTNLKAQDGQLDKTFNSTGIATTTLTGIGGIGMSGTAYSTLIQKDGKIVLVGTIGDGSQSFFCVMRYNQNGTIDSTFGINGIDTTAIGYTDDEAFCGLLQPDGKIIAAGYTSIGGAGSQRNFALVRYNTDGSRDSTFGSNGIVSTSISQSDDEIHSLTIQGDGKIVAAGSSFEVISNQAVYAFALVRYNPNGSIDSTFGTKGIITNALILSGKIEYFNIANSVLIQNDGKIVIGGYTGNITDGKYYFAVLRFDANGNADNTFGSSGISLAFVGDTNEEINSIALQSDGKIIAGGFSENTYQGGIEDDFTLIRFNQDGSIDNSFGSGGVSVTSIGHNNDRINAVTVESDDKIVVAGFSYNSQGSNLFALARYNSNGSLDNTFGNAGITTTDVGPFNTGGDDKANSVAIQSDGKIVASGSSLYNNFYNLYAFAVVRYTGSITTGVNLVQSETPQSFKLYQNYPNPFNPTTVISYRISAVSHVTLKVYDILGKEVSTLVNKIEPAGKYEVQFSGSNLPSGIYFYSIEAGKFREVRKMILIK